MGMQGLGSLFGARKISARATPEEPRPRARPASRPTPDLALAWLKDGNGQFVTAGGPVAGHARDEIAGLAKGQAPIAIIVGCSDSRVAPEILFQCRMGDLFVVRTAGASVDPAALGSIEYGVEHLGCPLVVVLGHSGCGAVTAATTLVRVSTTPRT